MERLNQEIDRVVDKLDELCSRIHPLLRQEPLPLREKDGVGLSAPLANCISLAASAVEKQADRLQDILNQLEI